LGRLIPFFSHLGTVVLRLGRVDEAIANFDAGLRGDPKMASALYLRGLVKIAKGDRVGGDRDIADAKAIRFDIAEQQPEYGFKAP
jgi:hypothetical protein